VPLTAVTVTDGMLGGVVCNNPVGLEPLPPGEGFSCEATAQVWTETVNVAAVRAVPLQVEGQPVPGVVVSATAEATVSVAGGMPEPFKLYLPLLMRYYAMPLTLPRRIGEEIPARATMEQLAGRTVTVRYRDLNGGMVEASGMWLIWTP
jgi:hypothetical protein